MIAALLTGLPFIVKRIFNKPPWANRNEMIIEIAVSLVRLILNTMNITLISVLSSKLNKIKYQKQMLLVMMNPTKATTYDLVDAELPTVHIFEEQNLLIMRRLYEFANTYMRKFFYRGMVFT